MQASENEKSHSNKLMEMDDQGSRISLFESVIAKYFEIIKSIMPKITSLSLQNQDFEKSILTIENKMAKMEKDQENLHFQMRTNHITIDSKLNSILSDYTNIVLQNAKIRKQTEQLYQQIKEGRHYREQNAQNNPWHQQQNRQRNNQNSPDSQPRQEREVKPSFNKLKNKKITFQEDHAEKKSQETDSKPNLKINLETEKSKNSISLQEQSKQSITLKEEEQNEEGEGTSSKNQVFNSDKMLELTQRGILKSMKSQKIMIRKGTLKSTTRLAGSKKTRVFSKSQKVILNREQPKQEDNGQKFEEVIKEIESFHKTNQMMKKNYQELMGEYCRVNQEQFNRIDSQIREIKTKLNQMDYYHVHMEKIKLTLENQISKVVRQLEKKIEVKVSKLDFNEHLIDNNKRLTAIHEERKRVANKEETKKAIEFLETKLNFICESMDETQKPPKLHLVDLDVNTFRSKGSVLNHRATIDHSQPDRQIKTREYSRPSNIIASQHQQRHSSVETPFTTKRQVESLHSRFKNEAKYNQQLGQCRPYSIEKGCEDTKTCRKTPGTNISLSQLKERSLEMLGKDKPKTQKKLKRQPLIFQYDC